MKKLNVHFVDRHKQEIADTLAQQIAESDWVVCVYGKKDDIGTAWFGMKDEMAIIGALHHAAGRISREIN